LAFPEKMWIFLKVDVVCSPPNFHDRYFVIKTENVLYVYFGIKTACLLKIRTYPLQSKIACKKEPSTLHAQHASISKLLHYLNSHFNQEGIQTIGKNILPARFCAPMNYLTTFLRDEAP